MQPVVEQLAALIKKNDWHERFDLAIKSARVWNIPQIEAIHTLEDYLKWMDNLLTWLPVEDHAGRIIYNHICEFYFFLDQPSVKTLQNKIVPRDKPEELTELSKWMVDFANAWGTFLDTTESITPETLETFYKSPRFNLDEYMPPPSGYKTFNQLFARHVKPGMRPVAGLSDPHVVVSAADSTFVGWWQINEHSKITVKTLEWSVLELLDGSPYRDRFKGGIFMHSFLNTTDYHRLHVPVSGTVLESRVIHGQVYLDVTATPVVEDTRATLVKGPLSLTLPQEDDEPRKHRISAVPAFNAEDATGYQFAQARGLLVLDSPIGLVAVLPIGMAQVSSVVMTAEVGKTLQKGEEFSYFQFGGSDHIVLFEAASNVALLAQPNVHYNQGACIGLAYPNR